MIVDWPRRRPGFVLAALSLVLLGSLFPRGYMPVSEQDRITVRLCSAYGQRTATLDLKKERAPRQHTGSSNCEGIFGAVALLPASMPLPAPREDWPDAVATPELRVQAPRYFHFDPNAPPHAPPLSIA